MGSTTTTAKPICESQDTVDSLREEIGHLRRQVQDLQIALQTSNEHGDLTQDHLYRLSTSLTNEVRERQAAEDKLHRLVQAMTREKCDLEIMVQLLVDQGDQSAEEGEKARVDGLTQIANRRRFDEGLIQLWEHCRLERQTLSLLICDVDHFKLYNDRYGHPAGDRCLQAVAQLIHSCFRPGDLVARYGGEEFAVILPRTSGADAVCAADRVRTKIEDAAIVHSASPVAGRVTLSIGVASTVPHEKAADANALIAEADRNLYLAKSAGRNRVVLSGSRQSSTY